MAKLDFVMRIFILGFLSYSSLRLTASQETDMHDVEVKLRKDLFKDYDKHILPPHNASDPVRVEMGMSLITIANVDLKRQVLESEGWLKLVWKDSRLQWNPSDYNGLDVMRLPIDMVWTPDIEIYNSDIRTSFREVLCLLYPTGDIMRIPPGTMYTYCHFVVKHYPYDTHKCVYKFGSWTHDGQRIDLAVYGNLTSIDLSDAWNDGGEWEIIESSAARHEKRYSCCEETYPDVTFKVTIRRHSPYHKAGIVCPLVANIFLILVSLWISPLSYHRITVNVVSFLSLVWILLHLVDKVPAVGTDIPLVMILCDILIVTSVITVVLSVWSLSVLRFRGDCPVPRWVYTVLESWVAKTLRVQAPKSFERFANDEPRSADNEVLQISTNSSQSNSATAGPWMYFFQVLDRAIFVICIAVLTSFIIVASAQ